MKIKTLTCFDVYNYGASLQAYALMKFLKNHKHEVKIINYKPDYLCGRYRFWYLNPNYKWGNNFILRFLYCLIVFPKRYFTYFRKVAFDKFTKTYLDVSSNLYKSNEQLKKAKLDADVVIAGSDQIWNSFVQNGKDPAFYLDFVKDPIRKISYAASFGHNKINKGYEVLVKSKLADFYKITVREENGKDILEKLNIKSTQVVDPVFLLNSEEWSLFLENVKYEHYILVYDFELSHEIKMFAKRLAKTKGLKIVSVNDFFPHFYANKNINNAGPIQFLSLIKNADYVVTNSFHGTAFSLIFEKQFFVFGRKWDKVNSRMESLLNICNLSSRIVNKEFSNYNLEDIDFGKVSLLLNKEIQRSQKILLKSLS